MSDDQNKANKPDQDVIPTTKKTVAIEFSQPEAQSDETSLRKALENSPASRPENAPATPSPILKALNIASGSANKRAPQLAFTEQPLPSDNYL